MKFGFGAVAQGQKRGAGGACLVEDVWIHRAKLLRAVVIFASVVHGLHGQRMITAAREDLSGCSNSCQSVAC